MTPASGPPDVLCALPGLAHQGSWDPEERETLAVKIAMADTVEEDSQCSTISPWNNLFCTWVWLTLM